MNNHMKKDKYIIYGKGKKVKDFLYVFQNINVVKCVTTVQELRNSDLHEVIVVVCTDDEKSVCTELNNEGIKYVVASDLFYLLEAVQIDEKLSVVVWGTGDIAKRFIDVNREIKQFEITGFLDRKIEQGETGNFYDLPVWNPKDIQFDNMFILIATTKYYSEIRDELEGIGIGKDRYALIDENYGKAALMMKRTYYDIPDVKNQFICTQPFEYMQIEENGKAICCCPDLINYIDVGNVFNASYNEIKESNILRIIQLSILNGTYSFCNHRTCYILEECNKNVDAERKEYSYMPKRQKVAINIDSTCNLYCSSCRNSIYTKPECEVKKMQPMIEMILAEIIPRSTDLYLSGNGEVFLSKVYREILYRLEFIDHIGVLSNGILFDEKLIYELKEKCNRISVYISVDAASEGTYTQIRRGGNFQRLMRNLDIVSELRKENVIDYFMLNFVVQSSNVHEVVPFAQLGKKLGVDMINYTRINNWGTYSKEEFEKISVMNDNENIKPEYVVHFKGIEEYKHMINMNNLGINDLRKNMYLNHSLIADEAVSK